MLEHGAIVRLVSEDPELVVFAGPLPEGCKSMLGAYGMVVKPQIARTGLSLYWHVVSFPDFGKFARVRSDAIEEY